jgi:plasmid stabilization system protein ParE
MIRIRISDEALADLDEGFWFYESQESGLGDYFASCLRGDISGLRISAGMHRAQYRDYRRLLSRVFPYAIYYTLKDNVAVVWAAVDCRRDPVWIREHLEHLTG